MGDVGQRLSDAFGTTSFFGFGVVAAILLTIAILALLPAGRRAKAAAPIVCFVIFLALFAASALIPETAAASQPVGVGAVFFLLLGLARGAYVTIAEGVFAARLRRPFPKIFGDIVQTVVYVGVVLVTLRAAGVEPGSLLTTSALLTAVVGLSLQDTLGNLFAGLSIQVQKPFEIGDWIQFDANVSHIGRVVEINWRATTVMTTDDVEIIVPNSIIAKTAISNYTKPTEAARRIVKVTCDYETPPRKVRDAVLSAIQGLPDVLDEPPAVVLVDDFAASGIDYTVRFFVREFRRRDAIESMVRERIWYALRRARIGIPYPTSEVHLVSHETHREKTEEARIAERMKLLRNVDFLAALPPEALQHLATLVTRRVYAAGEVVIHQGEAGDELYVIGRGQVSVLVGRDGGSTAEVARLHAGQSFGEMSLMTGERRTATVQCMSETELVVVGREAFSEILSKMPELAERIARIVVTRQEHLDEHLAQRAAAAAARQADMDAKTGAFVQKLRQFLQL